MDDQHIEIPGAERPAELTVAGRRLEREVRGEEIAVGDRRLRPLVRMTGWYGSDAHARAGLAWAWVRLQPAGVQVRSGDSEEIFVPVKSATAEALRGIALAGLVAAAVCWAVMLIRHLVRAGREAA